ncbi:MAG TPA: Eco47II family restriction endonuclease [Candidatus Limnocylindria bacterium]|nr:Eco47II family restriction endonuclease [Candidatus Limnocylindria bacterium]
MPKRIKKSPLLLGVLRRAYKLPDKQLLPFITNEALFFNVQKVIDKALLAAKKSEENLHSNVLDPFSAVFDASCQGISLKDWIKLEKSRQIQKTLQNAIGDFHQDTIGSISTWENLPTGGIVDVRNKNRKIIAEIKNKYNTTKFSDRPAYYDSLKHLIEGDYAGYTSYYVEVIPDGRKVYNEPFTPSDHIQKGKKPANEKIRLVDGKTFYQIATGQKDALQKLYEIVPYVASTILGFRVEKITEDKLFSELFKQAY